MVDLDLWDPLVKMELRVIRAHREPLEQQDHLEEMVMTDQMVQLERPVLMVPQDPQESQEWSQEPRE